MFEALHPSGKIFRAEQAIQTLLEPKKEKWTCIGCKEEVSLKKEFIRLDERCSYPIEVLSHFAHHPNSTCKDAKETTSHYNRKLYVLSQLDAKKVMLSTGHCNLLIPQEEIKGKEKAVGNRQADVLVSFKTTDPIFGAGIAFEIMETEKIESIESKMESWVKKGYSFSYFEPTEFSGNRLIKGKVVVKYPFVSLARKVFENLNSEIRQQLLVLRNIENIIELENKHNKKYTCETCQFSSVDKLLSEYLDEDFLCCWHLNQTTENKRARPEKHLKSYSCKKYQPDFKKLKKGEKNAN